MPPRRENDVGIHVKEQVIMLGMSIKNEHKERWAQRIYKNSIPAPSSPTHMLTHAHTRSQIVLEKQTQDQVIELQITFQGSTIGQNSSPCNTKSTTTLYARHSSEHFISI